MSTQQTQPPTYLAALQPVITETIAPMAGETDRTGAYPRAALQALGKAGLLGLISAQEVGGLGQGHRAATLVIEEIGKHCASTAMVLCMHYAGAAVIEAYGQRAMREAIAAGRSVTTLAFSETASRSHFWAATSSATLLDDKVRLDAKKAGLPLPVRPTPTSGRVVLWLRKG